MQTRPNRRDVPEPLTWDLGHIFATESAWEEALKAVEGDLEAVTAYQGRLGEGAGVLLACLKAREALQQRLRQVGAYASLRMSSDGSDPANQALTARVGALGARVGAATAFVESEIAALPDGKLEAWLKTEPGLEPYRHFLGKILKFQPHRLSQETEATLAALEEAFDLPDVVYRRAKAADLTFPPIKGDDGKDLPMSIALYEKYEQSPDRELRQRAYQSLTAGLNAHKTTFATTLAGFIRRNVVEAGLRKFGSAEEMILHGQQIPLKVYNQVVDTILAEGAPHVRRYMKLKQRVMGLDQVQRYDMKAPLDPEFDPHTNYAEGSALIQEAIGVMGPEYGKVLRTAMTERWIDLADNVGKSTGAFCYPVYGVHPYVLITWHDRMRDVFVLSHELGHAGHMYLTARNQPIVNAGWSWFFVEAPSTTNELLLGFHLLDRTTDKRMRRWIVTQFLGTFMHNFVTHMLEGELERRLYRIAEEGRPITVNTLMEQQGDVFAKYFDGAVAVDDGARLNWMLVGHYYTGLYPFTYSAGLSLACAVAEKIRAEGQPAVERWLNTLRAGGSKYPLELAAMAGVDMTSPEPLKNAMALFGRLVDELEQSFA